jgi:hypothetical protein
VAQLVKDMANAAMSGDLSTHDGWEVDQQTLDRERIHKGNHVVSWTIPQGDQEMDQNWDGGVGQPPAFVANGPSSSTDISTGYRSTGASSTGYDYTGTGVHVHPLHDLHAAAYAVRHPIRAALYGTHLR